MGNGDIKTLFQEVLGVSRMAANKMVRKGYSTMESIAEADTDDLVQALKLDFKTALEMIDKAYEYIKNHEEQEAEAEDNETLSFRDEDNRKDVESLDQRIKRIKEKLHEQDEAHALKKAKRAIKLYLLMRMGKGIDSGNMTPDLQEVLSREWITSDSGLLEELESDCSSLERQPDFGEEMAGECQEYLSGRYGELFSRIEGIMRDPSLGDIQAMVLAAGELGPFQQIGLAQIPMEEGDAPYTQLAKKTYNEDAFMLWPMGEIQDDIRAALAEELIGMRKQSLDIDTLPERAYVAMTAQNVHDDKDLFRCLRNPCFVEQRAIGRKSARLIRDYLQDKYGNVLDALDSVYFPFNKNDEIILERLYNNPGEEIEADNSLPAMLASPIHSCASPRLRQALAGMGVNTDEELLKRMQETTAVASEALERDMRQYVRQRYRNAFEAMAKEGFPESFDQLDVLKDVFGYKEKQEAPAYIAYDPGKDAIQQANEAYAASQSMDEARASEIARELLACGLIAMQGEDIDVDAINKKIRKAFAKENIRKDHELYALCKQGKLQEISGIGAMTIEAVQEYLQAKYPEILSFAENAAFPLEEDGPVAGLIHAIQEKKEMAESLRQTDDPADTRDLTVSLDALVNEPIELESFSVASAKAFHSFGVQTDRDLFRLLNDYPSFAMQEKVNYAMCEQINDYIKERYGKAYEDAKKNGAKLRFKGSWYLKGLLDETEEDYGSFTLKQMISKKIDHFQMSPRAYISLLRNDIFTDRDLFKAVSNMASFRSLRGVSRNIISEVKEYIDKRYRGLYEKTKGKGVPDSFEGSDFLKRLLHAKTEDTEEIEEIGIDYTTMALEELLDSQIDKRMFCQRSKALLQQLGLEKDRALFERLEDIASFKEATGNDRVFTRDINGYIKNKYANAFEQMKENGFQESFAGKNYLLHVFNVQIEEEKEKPDYSAVALGELLDSAIDKSRFCPRSKTLLEQLGIESDKALFERLEDIAAFKEETGNDRVFTRDINGYIKNKYANALEEMKAEGFQESFAGKNYLLHVFNVQIEEEKEKPDYSAMALGKLLDSAIDKSRFCPRSKTLLEQLGIESDKALFERLEDLAAFKEETGNDRVFTRDINGYIKNKYANAFEQMKAEGFQESFAGKNYLLHVFNVQIEEEKEKPDYSAMSMADLLGSSIDPSMFCARSKGYLQQLGLETDQALFERLEDMASLKEETGNDRIFTRDINGYIKRKYAQAFAQMRAEGFPGDFPGLNYMKGVFHVKLDEGKEEPREEEHKATALVDLLDSPLDKDKFCSRSWNTLQEKGIETDRALLENLEDMDSFKASTGNNRVLTRDINGYFRNRYAEAFAKEQAEGFHESFPGQSYLMNLFDLETNREDALQENMENKSLAELLEMPIGRKSLGLRLYNLLKGKGIKTDKEFLELAEKDKGFEYTDGFGDGAREQAKAYFVDKYSHVREELRETAGFAGRDYLMLALGETEFIPTLAEMLESPVDLERFSRPLLLQLKELGIESDKSLLEAMDKEDVFDAKASEEIDAYFREYYEPFYLEQKEQGFPLQFVGLAYLEKLFDGSEIAEGWTIDEMLDSQVDEKMFSPVTYHTLKKLGYDTDRKLLAAISNMEAFKSTKGIAATTIDRIIDYFREYYEYHYEIQKEQGFPVQFEGLSFLKWLFDGVKMEPAEEMPQSLPQEETEEETALLEPAIEATEEPAEETTVEEEEEQGDYLDESNLKGLAAIACKAYHDAIDNNLEHQQAENMMRDRILQEYIKVSDEPVDESQFSLRAMGILHKNEIKKDSDVFQAMTQKTEEMSRVLGDKLASDLGVYMRNKFGAILGMLQELSYPLEKEAWEELEGLFASAQERASKRRSVFDIDLAAIYERETLRNTSDEYIQKEIREVLFADLIRKCNERISPGALNPRVSWSLGQLNIETDGDLYDFSHDKNFVLTKGLGERALEQVEEYLEKKYSQYRWILNNLSYPFNTQDLSAVEALYANAVSSPVERIVEEEKVEKPKPSAPIEMPAFLPQSEIKSDLRERVEAMRNTSLENDKEILSTRAVNLLSKLGIVTEGDLLSAMKDREGFRNTRGLGKAIAASCEELVLRQYRDIYKEMEDVGFPYDFDGLETLKNLCKDEEPRQARIPFFDDEEDKEQGNEFLGSINMDDLPVYNYDLDDMESFVVDEITDDTPLDGYDMNDTESFVVNEIVETLDENVHAYLAQNDFAIVDETTQDLFDSLAGHGIILYSQLVDAYELGQLQAYFDVDMIEANDLIQSIKDKAEGYEEKPGESFAEYLDREGKSIDEYSLPQDTCDLLAEAGVRNEKDLYEAFVRREASIATVSARRYYNSLIFAYQEQDGATPSVRENTVYKVLQDNPLKSFTENELVEASGIDPKDFYSYLSDMLDNYDITVKKGQYSIVLPRARVVIADMENVRMARALLRHLGGDSYEQIGKTIGIETQQAKSMVRQGADELRVVCQERYGTDMMEEDRLSHVYQAYNIPDDAYIGFMNVSMEALSFLALYYKKGNRDMMAVLNDPDAPRNVKEGIEKYLRKSVIRLEGVDLLVNKQVMEDYILKTRCTEQTDISQFAQYYKDFISIYHLDEHPQLAWTEGSEAKIMQRMMRGRHVLCRSRTVLRFYDIDARDYTRLKEGLSLSQYHGREMSTEELFTGHEDLMKEYDILDKHELHYLLRRIYKADEVPGMTFGRNPNLSFA